MKHNTAEVATLQPDYLGFIFYEKSPRNYDLPDIPELRAGIKKVGVFVNAEPDCILEKVKQFNFDVIQLHGNESPQYCAELRNRCQIERSRDPLVETALSPSVKLTTDAVELPALSAVETPVPSEVEVWKVFSIKNQFDFSILEDYEAVVDKFLFDTKGKEKGGNGYTFDWSVLKDYNSKKPFILSGGIGLEELAAVNELQATDLPLIAIDVNSKFEDKPGLKNIKDLRKLFSSFSIAKEAK
ncbi:phosphoribosylanthranilate isomerase [Leeuwenhoekiella marinoflava]|uniref:phosphoribosylanthranilate isomerase n=1 Tax=Leeuwenhoekiella marinoflava TaxID=988 RepID=UPI003001888E